jgi:hypothetical protein
VSRDVTSPESSEVLHVVAECPVCPGAGCVVALKSAESGKLVYFAPCCGIAWWQPPLSGRIDEIKSLADLGVRVVTLPSAADIRTSGSEILRAEPFDRWAADIPLDKHRE